MTRVVIWVSDLEKSVAFYRDLFDNSTVYQAQGFASVGNAENEVLLHLVPEQYRGEASIGEENPIKPVFSIQSLDKAREISVKHSVEFNKDSVTHGSTEYLDGKDPDGHVIQVAVIHS